MDNINISQMSVAEWEAFLKDRHNTYEIPYHGGGYYLTMALRTLVSRPDCATLYAKVVQATLNCWNELDAVDRDSDKWEIHPIHAVADAAFGTNHFFIEDLRPYFNRLWEESPRPHSNTHRNMALNYGEQLPIKPLEVECLFKLSNWGIIAARIASKKGWNNQAIDLMEQLHKNETELKTSNIVELVKLGFPKIKGLRWIALSQNKGVYTDAVFKRWQQELLEEGFTPQEVFLEQ